VPLLKRAEVAPGARLLGVVERAPAGGAVDVALPHGLWGRAAAKEAPGCAVGQVVQCEVVAAPPAPAGQGGGQGQAGLLRVSLAPRRLQGAWLSARSVRPGLLLAATVTASQDHGLSLSFGASRPKGFLPFEAVRGFAEPPAEGALVEVAVERVLQGGNLARCSMDAPGLAAAVLPDHGELSLASLPPGALVSGIVQKVLPDGGLSVRFLQYFTGTVDVFHLPQGDSALEEGAPVRARVLYVLPQTKRVGLSLLPHLVARAGGPLPLPPAPAAGAAASAAAAAWDLPARGRVFDHAVVRRVDEGLGLLLALPDLAKDEQQEEERPGVRRKGRGGKGPGTPPPSKKKMEKRGGGRRRQEEEEEEEEEEKVEEGGRGDAREVAVRRWAFGYAHLGDVSDSRVASLKKAFRVGDVLRARVLGQRPVDGLARCTVKPSAVGEAGAEAGLEDLRPGAVVGCLVVEEDPRGLVVKLPGGLRTVVPFAHLTDLGAARAPQHLHRGASVKCRVLEVDRARRRVAVTLKRALVRSELPPLASAAEAMPGAWHHGFVTGVEAYGVFVQFYGGVRGLCPKAECDVGEGEGEGEGAGGASLQDFFRVWQPLKARIARVGADGRLNLSLRRSAGGEGSPGEGAPGKADPGEAGGAAPETGTVLPACVAPAPAAGAEGAADAEGGHVFVVLGGRWRARVPLGHLADSAAGDAAVRGGDLPPGAALGPAVVLPRATASGGAAAAGPLECSLKPSLLKAAGRGPSAGGASGELGLGPGWHWGWVASTSRGGVFVRFSSGATGRVAAGRLGPRGASPGDFALGQSLFCRALGAASGGRLPELELASTASAADLEGLESLFSARALAARLRSTAAGGDGQGGERFPRAGELVRARVSGRRDFGTLCDLEGFPDLVGLAPGGEGGGEEGGEEGAWFDATVLDCDPLGGVADIAARKDLVAAARAQAARGQAGRGWREGEAVRGQVELVKGEYAVAAAVLGPGKAATEPRRKTRRTKSEPSSAGGLSVVYLPALAQLEVGRSVRFRLAGEAAGGRHLALPLLEGAAAAGDVSGGSQDKAGSSAALAAAAAADGAGLMGQVVRVGPVQAEIRADLPGGRSVRGLLRAADLPLSAGAAAELGLGSRDFAGAERPGTLLRAGEELTGLRVLPVAAAAGGGGGAGGRTLFALDGSGAREDGEASEGISAGSAVTAVIRSVRGDFAMLDIPGGRVGRLWLPHALLAAGGEGTPGVEGAGGIVPAAPNSKGPWRGEASLGALASALRPGRRLDCVALARDAEGRWDFAAAGGAFVGALQEREGAEDGAIWELPESATGESLWAQVARVDAARGVWLRVAPGVVGLAALPDVADVPSQGLGAALCRELKPGALVPCASLGRSFSRGAAANEGRSPKQGTGGGGGPRPALERSQLALSLRESRVGGEPAAVAAPAGAEPVGGDLGLSVEDAARCRLRRKAATGEADLSGADVAAALAAEMGAPEGGAAAEATEPVDDADLAEGRVVLGFVKASGKGGVFVALPGGREARAKARELANGFVRDIAEAFPPGRLVRCRVLEQDRGTGRVELSLRPAGRLRGEPRPCPPEGTRLEALVRKVGQFGAFLDVPGGAFRGCSGLVPTSELPKRGGVEPGARLQCAVTDNSRGPSRLGLTLAAAAAEGTAGAVKEEDVAMGDVALDVSDDSSSEDEGGAGEDGAGGNDWGASSGSDGDLEMEKEDGQEVEGGSESDSDSYDSGGGRGAAEAAPFSDDDEESSEEEAGGDLAHALAVGGGARLPEENASSSDEEGGAGKDAARDLSRSAAKRAARRRADAREEAAQEAERGALAAAKGDFRLAQGGDGEEAGHSVEALRAWALGNPGDSYRWIRLMARQHAGGDADGARASAEEALRRIPVEAEGERMNVHAAVLGLEAQEGGEAACLASFRRALPMCDQKRLTFALLNVLEGVPAPDRGARVEAVQGALRRLRKQFPGSCKVAAREAEHYLLRGGEVGDGDAKAALGAVQAGLKRLDRRKHPKLLRQVAVEAFRVEGAAGPELGRHLLEAALAGWPRRSDLWLLYAAQEEALARKAGGGAKEKARRVFERAVGAAGASAKRARPALRAWAEFEKRQGEQGRPEAVREAAMALLGGAD